MNMPNARKTPLLALRRLTGQATAAALFLMAMPSAAAHDDVLYPDGGEVFQPGQLITIQWTVTIQHPLQGWDVLYSTTGTAGPWLPIALGLPPGDPTAGSAHSIDWVVPEGMTSTAAVRVSMLTTHFVYESISDGPFTITDPVGARGCAGQTPNSSGSAATLYVVGSAVAADNALTLNITDLPMNAVGYPVNSDTLDFTATPGSSQGNLCLGGTIGRHVTQLSDSGADGFVSIPLDLAALPRATGSTQAVAGQTWSFQYWTRDANPTSTSNFSDVVSVTLL